MPATQQSSKNTASPPARRRPSSAKNSKDYCTEQGRKPVFQPHQRQHQHSTPNALKVHTIGPMKTNRNHAASLDRRYQTRIQLTRPANPAFQRTSKPTPGSLPPSRPRPTRPGAARSSLRPFPGRRFSRSPSRAPQSSPRTRPSRHDRPIDPHTPNRADGRAEAHPALRGQRPGRASVRSTTPGIFEDRKACLHTLSTHSYKRYFQSLKRTSLQLNSVDLDPKRSSPLLGLSLLGSSPPLHRPVRVSPNEATAADPGRPPDPASPRTPARRQRRTPRTTFSASDDAEGPSSGKNTNRTYQRRPHSPTKGRSQCAKRLKAIHRGKAPRHSGNRRERPLQAIPRKEKRRRQGP